MRSMCFAGGVAALAVAGATSADTVILDYTIAGGTADNFGYSVLHLPANDQGSGDIIARLAGSFRIDFDTTAGSIALSRFDADVFEEDDLDPGAGPLIGGLDYVASALTWHESTGLVSGTITLDLSFNGDVDANIANPNSSGEVTFHFQAIDYNPRANRFSPNLEDGDASNDYRFGLWGATEGVFNNQPDAAIGDTGMSSLALDMFGEAPIVVPLPRAAGLALLGLGAVGCRRRR